jgi:uncharacterized protein
MFEFSSLSGTKYLYDYFTNNIYLNEDGIELPETENKIKFIVPSLQDIKNNKTESLIINLTNNCNMRCLYCGFSGIYKWQRQHENKTITFETAEKAVDFFIERSLPGQRRISFYGGEPTTAFPLLKKICEYVLSKDKKVILSANSNFLHITDDILNYFKSNNFQLYISLDGEKQIHDKNRVDVASNGTFDRIVENLTKLYKIDKKYYKSNIVFLSTLTPPYKISSLKKLYESNDVFRQVFFINTVMPFDNDVYTEINLYKNEDFLREIKELSLEYINSAIDGQAKTHFGYCVFGKGLEKLHWRNMEANDTEWVNGCCVPGIKFFVDCDGRFFPCERCSNFMQSGSVSEGFFPENNLKYMQEFKSDCDNKCSKCPNVRFCDLCCVSANENGKFNFDRKHLLCEVKLSQLRLLLFIYTSIMEKNPAAFDSSDTNILFGKADLFSD